MKKLIIVSAIGLIIALCNVGYPTGDALQEDFERSSDYGMVQNLKRDFKNGGTRARANQAIDAIMVESFFELRKKGAKDLADRLSVEYTGRYKNFLVNRDVGDHAGVAWLIKTHAEIEFVLGEPLCRTLRLHDLWVLAYTIPVVFNCEDKVDANEYKKHFVPFCSVVSFWVSYAVCSGVSLGTGVIVFCNVGAMGVEQVVALFIAPPLSDPSWKKVCAP